MAENVKIKKKQLKTNIEHINSEMKLLADEMKHLSEYLNTMMKGDGTSPYWNGQAAKTFYEKAINNLKNDIEDYKSAYTTLSTIAVKYEKLGKSDK